MVQLFERVATLEQALEKRADAAEFKSLQQKATQMVRDIAKLAAALGGRGQGRALFRRAGAAVLLSGGSY